MKHSVAFGIIGKRCPAQGHLDSNRNTDISDHYDITPDDNLQITVRHIASSDSEIIDKNISATITEGIPITKLSQPFSTCTHIHRKPVLRTRPSHAPIVSVETNASDQLYATHNQGLKPSHVFQLDIHSTDRNHTNPYAFDDNNIHNNNTNANIRSVAQTNGHASSNNGGQGQEMSGSISSISSAGMNDPCQKSGNKPMSGISIASHGSGQSEHLSSEPSQSTHVYTTESKPDCRIAYMSLTDHSDNDSTASDSLRKQNSSINQISDDWTDGWIVDEAAKADIGHSSDLGTAQTGNGSKDSVVVSAKACPENMPLLSADGIESTQQHKYERIYKCNNARKARNSDWSKPGTRISAAEYPLIDTKVNTSIRYTNKKPSVRLTCSEIGSRRSNIGKTNHGNARVSDKKLRCDDAADWRRSDDNSVNYITNVDTGSSDQTITPVHRAAPTDLSQFDVIGETSILRFPWQNDVGIQCDIGSGSGNRVNEHTMYAVDSTSLTITEDSDEITRELAELFTSVEAEVDEAIANNYAHIVSCNHVNGKDRGQDDEHARAHLVHQGDNYQKLTTHGDMTSTPAIATKVGQKAFRSGSADSDGVFEINDKHRRTRTKGKQRVKHRTASSQSDLENSDCYDDPEQDGPKADRLDMLLSNVWDLRRHSQDDVLPSPRVSPDPWSGLPELVVTRAKIEGNTRGREESKRLTDQNQNHYLAVPRKSPRRASCNSLTSGSEDSDCEPSPPFPRRGRRKAIFDSKNFGDVSPTNLSPDVSPSGSCDEAEGPSSCGSTPQPRRRSSLERSMNVYPGDLLVQDDHRKVLIKRNTISDFATMKAYSTLQLIEDCGKKPTKQFSLLKLMRARSKEQLARLEDVLSNLKSSQFKDNHLVAYKDIHWSDLIACSDREACPQAISETEQKRREAVWELFRSECVFLIDHLMVLKHCFMEPLKKVQVEGYLMYAEPRNLFGNLDELCYVSYTFCKEFMAALLKDMTVTAFGRTQVLIKSFEKFSPISRDGGAYHNYCLNYANALTYLVSLRRNDDFSEFEKWCEQDARCNRLQLTDLLAAPMQHCTKIPLLLGNIHKYTSDTQERDMLAESMQEIEGSLRQLEKKMKWMRNYERVQEIQLQLIWPPITELDPRTYIPEFLRSTLLRQPCERLLASPKRQLIHEGQLILVDSTKSVDMYLLLFGDILLMTKTKTKLRKRPTVLDATTKQPAQQEKGCYVVYRQPIPLDRFSIHDIGTSEAVASGLKNAFVLVHISRYQQIIGVYTFQTGNHLNKTIWLNQLREAQEKFNSHQQKEASISTSSSTHSFGQEKGSLTPVTESLSTPTSPRLSRECNNGHSPSRSPFKTTSANLFPREKRHSFKSLSVTSKDSLCSSREGSPDISPQSEGSSVASSVTSSPGRRRMRRSFKHQPGCKSQSIDTPFG